MKITICKSDGPREYNVASLKITTLLAALYEIKAKLDPTLTFDAVCRSGICGACAVRVNGRETLACSHTPVDGDIVEPLRYHPVLRDLKVDHLPALETLKTILRDKESQSDSCKNSSPPPLSPQEEECFRLQSDCILCDCCYSVCPVLEVHSGFLGPFALSRAWRYIKDPRYTGIENPKTDNNESKISIDTTFQQEGTVSKKSHAVLELVQKNGIWECTLCGECTAVCPQGLDPKGDILGLRIQSLRSGYDDPSAFTHDFGVPDFSTGFGFEQNP